MKDEDQIQALANLAGWIRFFEPSDSGEEGVGKWLWHKGNQNLKSPPNYLDSLDAAHELWCKLTAEQHKAFRQHLTEIVIRDGHIIGPCRSASNATARQRCEALLKTLGLWRNET